jgi:hypothetical protein
MMAHCRPQASFTESSEKILSAEWYFITKLGPQVSPFPVPISGVNTRVTPTRRIVPMVLALDRRSSRGLGGRTYWYGSQDRPVFRRDSIARGRVAPCLKWICVGSNAIFSKFSN